MSDSPLPEHVTPRTVSLFVEAHRNGHPEALGRLLYAYRTYLLAIARREFDSSLTGKLSPTDILQETFIDAHRDFSQFTSSSHTELKRWLRKLLVHNLEDFRRLFLDAEKRDVRRERRIDWLTPRDLAESIVAPAPLSPLSELIHSERAGRLEAAVLALPERDRQLLYLRHQLQLSYVEIGERLRETHDAVRMRYMRLLGRLKRTLEEG